MWKHILFVALMTSHTLWSQSEVPAIPGQIGCTPDSLLFEGNPRFWYPGEPIQWANQRTLDSLIACDMDGFRYTVESPRTKGYCKLVRSLKSPEGNNALYVDGDLRYISYNGGPNQSRSIVVGHNFRSHAYWYQEQLHFQNGWANWFKHTQRLYHSKESKEIELRQSADAPLGAENAVIFSNDTASFFIMITGHLEDATTTPDIYCLLHKSSQWQNLGRLNSNIKRVNGNGHSWNLKDYIVLRAEGTFLVLRKTDLYWTVMPSALAQFSAKSYQIFQGKRADSWFAWKGNTAEYSGGLGTYSEDISELVEGAEWSPLIVPAPPETWLERVSRAPVEWAIILGLMICAAALVSWRVMSRRPMSMISSGPLDGHAAPSPVLLTLLKHSKRKLSSEELDVLIGLAEVHSPETRRSRRARIIQLVNTESMARFGQPMLVRTKLDSDKRVVIYSVQDPSGTQ